MEHPYEQGFRKQQTYQQSLGQMPYKRRIHLLNALQQAVEHSYRERIIQALQQDLAKPKVESELTEIYQILGTIKHAKKHLHKWMRPQRVSTPMAMLGASSSYVYEPKGVVLVISPWNFPFNLTFGPLATALAAGNSVIIKPSEMTPHSSALMEEIVSDIFKEEEVRLYQGAVDTSTALLKLPFNHIFFTGSPAVGKIVMTAAAKHLASVTLELGGKSPTIIDASANLETAAKKIMWAKSLNCGQICVAPDYVLIDQQVKVAFIGHCKNWLQHYFSDNPQSSASYGRIVTERHFERLQSHMEDARVRKASIVLGGEIDPDDRYISPTLFDGVDTEAKLLQEEIFGPLLPLVSYSSLDEAINFINSKERPLALYIYSKNKAAIRQIMQHTKAGSTVINNSNIHYGNHELPFGGINNSGIGKSHGFFGFQAFSNQRALMKQHSFGITELLFPPYTNLKEKLAALTIKWF
jgi:aldehyde dehydrogenase (NAD+)